MHDGREYYYVIKLFGCYPDNLDKTKEIVISTEGHDMNKSDAEYYCKEVLDESFKKLEIEEISEDEYWKRVNSCLYSEPKSEDIQQEDVIKVDLNCLGDQIVLLDSLSANLPEDDKNKCILEGLANFLSILSAAMEDGKDTGIIVPVRE